MSTSQRTITTRVVVLAATVSLLAIGCGSTRSIAQFCETHEKHKSRYLSAMEDATSSEDPFAGLIGGAVALGDLNTMWQELAEVAPEEIRSDTEIIAESWSQMYDEAGDRGADPLRGLGNALGQSMKIAGPMQRVDSFVRTNCDTAK